MNSDETSPPKMGAGPLSEQERVLLEEHLEELKRAGFLERLSKDKCAFSNNLTWEVIYKSLMFSERRRFHGLVAAYLEQSNAIRTEDIADLLLYHYEAANDWAKTAHYGVLAGDKAARIYANKEAINSYERARDALLAIGEDVPADFSVVFEKIADVQQSSGEYKDALQNYMQAYEDWNSAGLEGRTTHLSLPYGASVRNLELCRKISVAHENDSDYGKAAEWIDKAIALSVSCPDDFASGVYSARSVLHYRKGEFQEALESGQQALALAKRSGEPAGIAYGHTVIAAISIPMGKLHDAISNLKKAISLYNDLQDYMGIAKSNSNLGICSMWTGKLDQAIEYYNVAIEAETKIQNRAKIAIEHNNIGEVYLQKGDLDKAIEYLGRVIEANEAGDAHNALAGYAMMNLSRCYTEQGELEEAQKTIERSLEFIRESGTLGVDTEAELQQAEIHLARGQYVEAEALCSRTMEAIRQQGAELLEARGKRILAKLCRLKGDWDNADRLIGESIDIAHKNGSKYEEALSTREHGLMLRQKGSSHKVVLFELEIAADLFRKIGAEREYGITQRLIEEGSTEQT